METSCILIKNRKLSLSVKGVIYTYNILSKTQVILEFYCAFPLPKCTCFQHKYAIQYTTA